MTTGWVILSFLSVFIWEESKVTKEHPVGYRVPSPARLLEKTLFRQSLQVLGDIRFADPGAGGGDDLLDFL
jgi:hypothetical protein